MFAATYKTTSILPKYTLDLLNLKERVPAQILSEASRFFRPNRIVLSPVIFAFCSSRSQRAEFCSKFDKKKREINVSYAFEGTARGPSRPTCNSHLYYKDAPQRLTWHRSSSIGQNMRSRETHREREG